MLSALKPPSGKNVNVFADPIKLARSVLIFAKLITDSLWGTVTLTPENPILGKFFKVISKSFSDTLSGI